jgi:hypothetical protein
VGETTPINVQWIVNARLQAGAFLAQIMKLGYSWLIGAVAMLTAPSFL